PPPPPLISPHPPHPPLPPSPTRRSSDLITSRHNLSRHGNTSLTFANNPGKEDNSGVSLEIGNIALSSPVVLAPMAGVTNVAFRTLCREQEMQRTGTISGLYVCEMVTARALVERNEKTLHMTTFAPDENPRSLQLYTVDPQYTYEAAKMIVDENLADHIDMNFGCPVPKVTRRGGGSAIPYKRRLFENIVSAAVRATEGTDIPVTVKFRVGIDDDHHTHLDAGRIAVDAGAKSVALHARTAAQRYSGQADWNEIARLNEHLADTGVPRSEEHTSELQ